MRSYKSWKLINESVIPGRTLGIVHPRSVGLQSNIPGVSLSEKKKMNGDVVVDDEPLDDDESDDSEEDCSCKGKKKKGKVAFSKKNCKKMKKNMKDDVDFDDDDEGGSDDDVNDVDLPNKGEEGDDDDEGGEEDIDDVGGDKGEEGEGDDDDDKGGEEEDDDGGDDAPKFGFMKDKGKKKKGKKVDEANFWKDIQSYHVPKSQDGSDQEFFDSLARQYGDPKVRFHGGIEHVNEDLLLSPDQQALIDAMPNPGEAGYAPSQRLGGNFAASEEPELGHLPYGESAEYEESVEESADYEVLCKYFREDVARELIEKKRS